MSRSDSWRNQIPEESLLDKIDRGRSGGVPKPKQGAFEEGVKIRLHEAKPGDSVRQVLSGANNLGPLLRVVDPKAGLLESRDGRQTRIAPKSQVMKQI